ncbi:MAG: ankyrin repeat domain-containing protein [Alphaproteobacteria bacterium]|nr:ankyrin repeat domain-containing protein [Alphaproteobacteria bacterium]
MSPLRHKCLVTVASLVGFLSFGLHTEFADAEVAKMEFKDPLVAAADQNFSTEVMSLLKKGHAVNATSDFGTTALMRAAYRGNVEIINALIKAGADANLRDVGGASSLGLAVRQGNADAVTALIKGGADVNQPDNEGWSPLMRAAYLKDTTIFKTLLSNGAGVNYVNKNDESPLTEAVRAGNANAVTLLLKQGAHSATALDIAKRKHADSIIQLLEKGPVLAMSEREVETAALKDPNGNVYQGLTPPSVDSSAKVTSAAKEVKADSDKWNASNANKFVLQLGLFDNEEVAKKKQAEINNGFPELLSDLTLSITKTNMGPGQTGAYVLRANSFIKESAARDRCAKLALRDVECLVIEQSSTDPLATAIPPVVAAPEKSLIEKPEAFPAVTGVDNPVVGTPWSAPTPSLEVPLSPSKDIKTAPKNGVLDADEVNESNPFNSSSAWTPLEKNASNPQATEEKIVSPKDKNVTASPSPKNDKPSNDKPKNDTVAKKTSIDKDVKKPSIDKEATIQTKPAVIPVEPVSAPKEVSHNSREAAMNKDIISTRPGVGVSEAVQISAESPVPMANVVIPGSENLWAELGNFTDAKEAEQFWGHLSKPSSITVKFLEPAVARVEGGNAYIQAGPFASVDAVKGFCDAIDNDVDYCQRVVQVIQNRDIRQVKVMNHQVVRYQDQNPYGRSPYYTGGGDPYAVSGTGIWLQLGSFANEGIARSRFQEIRRHASKDLEFVEPVITSSPYINGSKQSYRLRVGPFASASEASDLSERLKMQGILCMVITK